MGQQGEKLRRKLRLCLTTLSTAASAAASNIITVSTSNTMWLFFSAQPGGIGSSVLSSTIFLSSSAAPLFIPFVPLLLSPHTHPTSPILSFPSLSRSLHPSTYQHVVADFLEFRLDLHAVIASHLLFLLVPLRLLLDAGDDAPGWTTGPHLTETKTTST